MTDSTLSTDATAKAEVIAKDDAPPTPAPTPPEVRQCQDPDDWQFGSVAVRSVLPGFAWGVFNPATGGHWDADDSKVVNWKALS